MNRRQFLKGVFAAVPAVALAPQAAELLAEMLAPRRTIFLPPAGGWTQYGELAQIVRRAFVPQLVAQIYNSSPLLKALLAHGEAYMLYGEAVSKFPLVEAPTVTAVVRRYADQKRQVPLLPPAEVLTAEGLGYHTPGALFGEPLGARVPPRLTRNPDRAPNYGTIEAALANEAPAYFVPSAAV